MQEILNAPGTLCDGYAIGVTDAVPKTVEASLRISEAALIGLGIPMGFVIAPIHGKRGVFRAKLREAVTEVGRELEYSA